MSWEADCPVAPAFGWDLDWVADSRGLLAPEVLLAFGFAFAFAFALPGARTGLADAFMVTAAPRRVS
jgi:hypothetical protein